MSQALEKYLDRIMIYANRNDADATSIREELKDHLLKKISERGITKIIIEHDMHVVFSLAQKISVLAQGTVIAEGKPDEIKGNPVVIEAYLGGELG